MTAKIEIRMDNAEAHPSTYLSRILSELAAQIESEGLPPKMFPVEVRDHKNNCVGKFEVLP